MIRSSSRRKLSLVFSLMIILVSPIVSAAPVAAAVPSGEPWAWGWNIFGQLGNGTNTNSVVPAKVSNITGVTSVAGGLYHTLAIDPDGNVLAWGYNVSGELGNGTNNNSTIPVQVSNITGIKVVTAGSNQSLALDSYGNVWAWGWNGNGELGNGTNNSSNIPVPVSGLSGIVAIAAGVYHSMALDSNGIVRAWGSNGYGQLGNASNTNSNRPVQVSNLTGVAAISGGGNHSLALDSNGNVWAWGENGYGELGNGTNANSNIPVQVKNLSGVTAIAAGFYHSVALDSNGKVWAWGWNGHGALGNGTDINSNIPVPVSNITGIAAIAAGGNHSLALSSNGTAWAWGWNYNGALGNGTEGDSGTYLPGRISNLAGVTAIAGGYLHGLAIKQICPTVTTTQLTASSITLGRGTRDRATVSNQTSCFSRPTGVVTFEVSPDGSRWSPFGSAILLDSYGNAVSGLYTPPAAGNYYFRAIYSGDASHKDSQSGNTDERLVVNKIPTTVSTRLSSSYIRVNRPVTERVIISTSAVGVLPGAGGTWVVQASRSSSFAYGVVTVDSGVVSGGLPFTVTTKAFTPTATGRWYFRAVYSGDDNYRESSRINILTVVR